MKDLEYQRFNEVLALETKVRETLIKKQ